MHWINPCFIIPPYPFNTYIKSVVCKSVCKQKTANVSEGGLSCWLSAEPVEGFEPPTRLRILITNQFPLFILTICLFIITTIIQCVTQSSGIFIFVLILVFKGICMQICMQAA